LDLFLASPEAEGTKSTWSPCFILASKRDNKMLITAAGEQG
jgi:hypothetical protein